MTDTVTFLRQNWDLDLRAELYKQEFFRAPAWTTTEREQWVVHWDSSTRQELDDLLGNRMAERPEHIGSIIREQQSRVLIGYWYGRLKFGPTTHPFTTELVHASIHLAGSVATYFKNKFNRVRPWVVEPTLSPPLFPLPGHPAYPSGHSTQAYLMARTLAYLVPGAEEALLRIARTVATNRERAGLNYASDTEAGRMLAERVFSVLVTQCPIFQSSLAEAKDNEWGTDVSLFAAGLPL